MENRRSEAEQIARLEEKPFQDWLSGLTDRRLLEIEYDWSFWRRPDQAAPEGPWGVWLLMAGRGFGKTRSGAEWVRQVAESDDNARIALVGASIDEARRIMVEGESGLLAIAHPDHRPVFEPSLKRLRWPGGAMAHLYSAAEPEGLRGPQHSHGWTDEIGKWPNAVLAWDMLAMTMRQGADPRLVATTTPRPTALIQRLMRQKDVVLTRGRMQDNRANLATGFRIAMERVYSGTRLGRQELDGELFGEGEGALWSRATIEAARETAVPEMRRVVIGVDPPATAAGDACGIVVAGRCAAGRAWVLADETVGGVSPEGWSSAVASAARRWRADRIVAERNNGGDMVESVLRAANAMLPLRLVHASRGKAARAEPVAALYEKGRVAHAGAFPALEDELCGLMAGGGYEAVQTNGAGRSPDRADALVWAMTELMLQEGGEGPRVRML